MRSLFTITSSPSRLTTFPCRLQTARLDGTEKFVTIFKRTGKGRPLEVYRDRFPRKALTVFSEVWKKELDREGNAGLLVIEEMSGNMLPYDLILNWMELCIEEGNDIKFPEVSAVLHYLAVDQLSGTLQFPTIYSRDVLYTDNMNDIQIDEGHNQLHVLLDVIAVADYIKIPGKSLQEPLKKSAIKYARKNLIDIDYVARLYDTADDDDDGADRPLQEAAAASIFEAWWTRQLDDPEFDEYCSHVEQLRVEFEQLDHDLNARFEEKKDFMGKKREERRNAAKAGYNPIITDVGRNGGADGGWGTAATEASVAEGEWAAGGGDDYDANGGDAQTSSGWGTGGGGGW